LVAAPRSATEVRLHGKLHGLAIEVEEVCVSGHVEWMAAAGMVKSVSMPFGSNRPALGADRSFNANDLVKNLRKVGEMAYVVQTISGRRSQMMRHPNYTTCIGEESDRIGSRKRSFEIALEW
jgi:hypothetical protein